MSRVLPFLPFVLSLLLLPAARVAAAAPALADDPAPYLAAFQQTCLTAFPDFDAIGRTAIQQGWQETTLTIRGDPGKDMPKALPRAFRKDGMMLFLTTVESGPLQRVCQIGGTAATRRTGADVAALVSPVLNAGEPEMMHSRSEDEARWTTAPGMSVQAGIAIYGRMRTYSFAVRQQR